MADRNGIDFTSMNDAMRRAAEGLGGINDLQDRIRAGYQSPVLDLIKQFEAQQAMRRAVFGGLDFEDRFRSYASAMGDVRSSLTETLAGASFAFREAQEHAAMARALSLPSPLENFRTSFDDLSLRMLSLDARMLGPKVNLDFFNQASALSDMMRDADRVGRDFSEAVAAFRQSSMPVLDSLSSYRSFFDGTGLVLPRWPKIRLLTKAEKRRRFRDRLKAKAEPPHVKRAKSLVHRYELTLRDILDAVMAEEYGEDWAESRLPLCDCKDLLGKWRKRGGEVLDHADYAHYGRIMAHPEHFAAIFEAAFTDPEFVLDLMRTAGNLRAASHHGREFSPEDLRDLRVTWKTIEAGLVVFTDDYEVLG